MQTGRPDSDAPPWPGMVAVAGGVVTVPASERWPAHESYAAPCWLEREPRADDGRTAAVPTVAQLVAAAASGAIDAIGAVERTASFARPDGDADADGVVLHVAPAEAGPIVVAGPPRGTPVRARRVASLDERGAPWRPLLRPCVPRHGRGTAWPAVRVDGGDPWLVDRGDRVVIVHEDGAWTLVAASIDEHAVGWVPTAAIGERDAEEDAVGPDLRASSEAVAGAIVALAQAAAARLAQRDAAAGATRDARDHAATAAPDAHAAADAAVADRVADLLDAWPDVLRVDEARLAALSALDLVVLALAAAPALDRATARRYRRLAEGDAAPLTVGLVADLAGASVAARVRLLRRLARDLPLRTGGLVAAGDAPVPAADAPLTLGPWLPAALCGLDTRDHDLE